MSASVRASRSFRSTKSPASATRPDPKSHDYWLKPEEFQLLQETARLNPALAFSRLAELGGVQGLSYALCTHPKDGLYKDEIDMKDDFKRRCDVYGQNKYPEREITTFFQYCIQALEDPMLRILIFFGFLSIVLGLIDGHGWYEGIAILLAVVLVTVIGALNNYQSDSQFRSLDAEREPPKCQVMRGGATVEVFHTDLVVGDVVLLDPNSALIPADGIMILHEGIKIDASKETGESLLIPKNLENPFLQDQTSVAEGSTMMLVTCVGARTSYGQTMAVLATGREDTPLQEKLTVLAGQIGYLGFGTAVVLFLVLLIWWLVEKDYKKDWALVIDYFIIAVTIVVVAVPEGLPLAVIISLVYSMRKMRKDNNLVRELSACETMGNATTICSDKTGTLTQNSMKVTESYICGLALSGRHDGRPRTETGELKKASTSASLVQWKEENEDGNKPTVVPAAVREILSLCILVNSQAEVKKKSFDKSNQVLDPEKWQWNVKANETEKGVCSWLLRSGYDIEEDRKLFEIAKILPFESVSKESSVMIGVDNDPSRYTQYKKGAAENILHACSRYMDSKGGIHEMSDDKKKEFKQQTLSMSTRGLRTIGFSYVSLECGPGLDVEVDDLNNLSVPKRRTDNIYVGVVGIMDPLRPESRRSVRSCQRAGVIVRMVTGDALETARFIAKDCGILTSDKHVAMTGEQYKQARLDLKDEPEKLAELIRNLRVLARSSPQDKKTLVDYLRSQEQVVGVTGDGTNDAPALKSADVGLAMYLTGTAVAHKAAHILILDDNFASIVNSVMWGRSVYDNIRKFVQFQLTVNIVALSLTVIGACSGFANPLKAVQLLWVNLIMDTMGALALGTETPTKALLARKPYSRNASLISPVMWRNILSQAALQLILLLVMLYDGEQIWDRVKTQGRGGLIHYTMIFNAFVYLQVFNEINSRKVNDEYNVFNGFFENYVFTVVILITVGMQFLMVQVFGPFATTTSLDWFEWLTTITVGAFAIPVGAVVRLIPVNFDWGRIVISEDTFAGANLHENDGEKDGHAPGLNADAKSSGRSQKGMEAEKQNLKADDRV